MDTIATGSQVLGGEGEAHKGSVCILPHLSLQVIGIEGTGQDTSRGGYSQGFLRSLQQHFGSLYFDETCKNVSRVCYERARSTHIH